MDTLHYPDPARRRRCYNAAFKAQLVAACRQPGVSISAMALANQINVSVLQRWVRNDRRQRRAQAGCLPNSSPSSGIPAAFLSLARSDDPAIHLELRHHDLTLHIDWPATQARICGDWLSALLR